MRERLSHYKGFWNSARKALRSYMQEMSYFYRAKVIYPASRDNQSLLIRKRAHHLERFLLKPHGYSNEFGKSISAELEELLRNARQDQPLNQMRWARKVLREYYEGRGDACLCPLINKNGKRLRPEIETESFLKLLRNRRSRRMFLDTPLTAVERERITEAAQWAPSSCNRQTLELIFVEEHELKAFVSSTIPGGHQFFGDAPSIIVLVADARDYKYPDERMNPFIEGAAAVQNIYLLCETMGLGCCWGSYTSFGGMFREDEVRKRLGIPPTHLIVASLAVGRSEQGVCPIPRDPSDTRYGVNRFRVKQP